MEALVLDVPALYADHHVVEVRRILLEVPGVDDVDASSAFRTVMVTFDADRTSAEALRKVVAEAGYLGDLGVPLEAGAPAVGPEAADQTYFRHSTAHEIAGTSVAFEQELSTPGRPLWPCPGIDRTTKEEQIAEV